MAKRFRLLGRRHAGTIALELALERTAHDLPRAQPNGKRQRKNNAAEKNAEGQYFIDPSTAGNYTIVNGRVVDKTTKGIIFSNEISSLGDPNPKFNVSFINGINTASSGSATPGATWRIDVPTTTINFNCCALKSICSCAW